jgi:GT2 family glycosyltransferase
MMKQHFMFSVIVVLWNSEDYLPICLKQLSQQNFQDFEVVLVDNGSTDNAVDELNPEDYKFPIKIEKLTKNLGFAAANNISARLARGKYLVLLNADAFPEPDWLERLLDAAKIYPDTFFSSRQVQANKSETLDGEGDVYHVSGLGWRHNYGLPVYPSNQLQEVFSACGAAALFPRQAFLDAGGFDEDYFSYHEDVDLGFRLRLRGLNCMLVPQAVVHHVGSASTGKRSDFSVYYGHRNLVWTYFKDMPALLLWLYLPLHALVNLFFLIYFTFKGQGRAIWRAKIDALRGLPKILKKRRAIQLQRKVSVGDIHRVMSRNWLTPFLAFLQRKSE